MTSTRLRKFYTSQAGHYSLRVIPTLLKHYSDIVSDTPSGSIYGLFITAFYLTLFLAYTLTFYLASILKVIVGGRKRKEEVRGRRKEEEGGRKGKEEERGSNPDKIYRPSLGRWGKIRDS